MDNKSPEMIERAMKETRESLTEKVAALEQQVVGTVHEATAAVHDTVRNVKESVSNVTENVRATFDIASHVRQNPWTLVGGATAAGFLTGFLTGGGPPARRSTAAPRTLANGLAPSPAVAKSSFWDDLVSAAQRELMSLGEQALAQLSSSVKKNLSQGIETLADNAGSFVGSTFASSRFTNYGDDAVAHNGRASTNRS